ncbi:MAG: twin-arginine translocase subunit TatC [Bacteroidales bacterium]|nr:twin-arginine translocase subunit TatC [Bacteroidales bacterium]
MSEKTLPENTEASEGKEMTFWDHLEELRWHLVRSIAAIIILGLVAFLNKDILFNDIILAPKSSDFISNRALCEISKWISSFWTVVSSDALCVEDFNLTLININMAGQFLIHLYISMFAGIIVAIPYIIWEVWSFIKPALYKHEQQYARGAVFWSSFLFLFGISFSYFIIVPLAVMFLGTYNVSETVANQISLNSYISTVVSLTFAVGLVFELPIFVYFLTKVGIITPSFMRKNRRMMIIVVLVISAIITPPDVFSQILVAFPLLGLYEISIIISGRVYKKRMEEMGEGQE